MAKPMYWSCKLGLFHTLKRHRTFQTAAKRVGDHGFVYSEADESVKQIFHMSDDSLRGYDIDKLTSKCNLGDFDMRKVLREFNIIK